jgi:nucleoid-associated protein YgaU
VTHELSNIVAANKLSSLRLVYVLLAVAGSGTAYLSYRYAATVPDAIDLPQAAVKAPQGLRPPDEQPAQQALLTPSFDAVSTGEGGTLVAAGRAPAGATVLLQNGTQTLGQTKADGNGEWVLMLDGPLPPGGYTLSLTAVDPKTGAGVPGKQTVNVTIAPGASRPLLSGADRTAAAKDRALNPPAQQAEKMDAPADTTAAPKKSSSMAAVKRGDTLWGLARRFYGKGERYPEIHGANKQQIKNPHLIYPNQQLEIPR